MLTRACELSKQAPAAGMQQRAVAANSHDLIEDLHGTEQGNLESRAHMRCSRASCTNYSLPVSAAFR
jgi:hypothetical protein